MYRVARPPLSKLIALLPAADPPPTFEDLERNLSRACLPVTLRQNASGSRIRAVLQELGGTRRFNVEVNATEFLPRYLELARLRGGNFDAAFASQFFVSVSCKLGRDVLDSLHAQLRLLAALAPEAVAMLDVNAFHARTGDWLRDAASASVPPAPTSFFSVHSVFDDSRKGRGTWLHTHGLHRMGCIELDVVGVRRRDAAALGELINSVARFFLDCGVPPPHTRFHAGNDLPLVWLPWEAGLQQVDVTLGGMTDRDADHGGERGILFAPAKDSSERLETPRCYVPMIEADPIFYVSSAETERMQRLARERLPRSSRSRAGTRRTGSGTSTSSSDSPRTATATTTPAAERSTSGSMSMGQPPRAWTARSSTSPSGSPACARVTAARSTCGFSQTGQSSHRGGDTRPSRYFSSSEA